MVSLCGTNLYLPMSCVVEYLITGLSAMCVFVLLHIQYFTLNRHSTNIWEMKQSNTLLFKPCILKMHHTGLYDSDYCLYQVDTEQSANTRKRHFNVELSLPALVSLNQSRLHSLTSCVTSNESLKFSEPFFITCDAINRRDGRNTKCLYI